MMTRRWWFQALVAAVAVGAVGYIAGRARASAVPKASTLIYSGVLTDLDGKPLSGSKNILIALFDKPTMDGVAQCTVGPLPQTLSAGAFQVDLAACLNVVRSKQDLWVEVFVGTESLGRSKLSAAPYALEADHAAKADLAVKADQATEATHAVNADKSQGAFEIPGKLTVGGGIEAAGSVKLAGDVSAKGPLIRKIARAQGLGPNDETDNGAISSRTLTFTKTQAGTAVRVSYIDNFRVTGEGNGACRWEIRFNGASCSAPGALVYDIYQGGVAGMSHHRFDTAFGTCAGLAVGDYTIQVYTSPVPGHGVAGDCYTGWNNQYWSIEAEEVL